MASFSPHVAPTVGHRGVSHERRVFLMAMFGGAPAVVVSLILLWGGDFTPKVQWTLTALIAAVWLAFAFSVRERVVLPLQTISNVLAALREGDYSIRARGARRGDALGDVVVEVNALGETLRQQRYGAVEATALLQKVMAEIDVAVFAFDHRDRLKLVNRAGERLLTRPASRLLDRTAAEVGLADCLSGEPTRTLQRAFPGGIGRWGLRRSSFREGGMPHQLLVMTDLSRTLREEERQAWQRLLRVLGHELNNSLTPIKSMAGSLSDLVQREPPPPDWKEDMLGGLAVVAARAEALSRFMKSYSRLARLPPPRLRPLEVGAWIRRVAELETRLAVRVVPGPELTIRADGDQLDQLLINLIKNAVDASLETGGQVAVAWSRNELYLEVRVEDEGPGLANTTNLFVPFFTTKRGGSGIGLVLSRQIAEAHGGALTLEPRTPGHGCEARLRLPL
jgi:nitrogen fixation/metabolism regulation signal transduction histidine kinase